MEPYYDRKTILLEADHEFKTSKSSEDGFVTIGRTLTSLAEHATPVKLFTPPKSITEAQPKPQTMVNRAPIDIIQEAPQIPEATLHT